MDAVGNAGPLGCLQAALGPNEEQEAEHISVRPKLISVASTQPEGVSSWVVAKGSFLFLLHCFYRILNLDDGHGDSYL